MKLKLACPHCQTVGVVPPLMMQAGDWPIACHYCHQHYYAPVMTGLSAMERQVELICDRCETASRIEAQAFGEIQKDDYALYCSECHHELPTTAADTTLILSQPTGKARQNEQLNPSFLQPGEADTQPGPDARLAAPGQLSLRAGLFFILAGFGIVGAAVMAAQEGLIDRVWLDNIMAGLPEADTVIDKLASFMRP